MTSRRLRKVRKILFPPQEPGLVLKLDFVEKVLLGSINP